MVGIVERLVPDELWELFQRVAPEAPTRPQGGGRRRHGDREVPAAIVFVATSGLYMAATALGLLRAVRGNCSPPVHRVDEGTGVGQAAPPRTRRTGLPRRPGLVPLRDRFGEHAGPKKGELTGPNPVDRGKYGSKIHLVTERSGLPPVYRDFRCQRP